MKNTKRPKNQKGTTLLELIVSLGIIMIIFVGIYNLVLFSLKVTADNKAYVEATEIVNQKMEEIRNMPYTDVGTLTGSPAGIIPEYDTVSRGNEYTTHTMVMFYDDPYDGTQADIDTVFTDYKIATIEISWQGRFGPRKISVFSKVIPNTEETLAGYGLLKIFTADSNGAPVPNANIHIENSDNGLLVDLVSDANGVLSYPVLPGVENYQITVTKANHGTERTHDRDATNPNPSRPHLSIFEGVKTEESFSIDKLSVLNIQVVANTQPANWLVDGVSTFNDRKNADFDIDSFDNMYFIWQSENATSSKILMQKYNSSEVKQWTNPLELESSNFQINPDITTDSSGNSYIVWQDNSVNLKSITFSPSKAPTQYAKAPSDIKIDSSLNHFKPPRLQTPSVFNTEQKVSNNKNNIWDIISDKFIAKTANAGVSDIFFIGAEGSTTGNDDSITINLPAGTVENDFLLAYIHHDTASDGPIEAPAGWNTLNNNLDPSGSDSDSRGNIFWKFAGASEPANYTFYTREVCSSSWSWWCWCWQTTCNRLDTRKAGHIRAYRNVDPADPFDLGLVHATTAANNQEHSTPSHNVSSDGSMLICGWGSDTAALGDGTPSFPASLENPMNSNANNACAASADKQVGTADSFAAIANYNANKNVDKASINWSLVLKPIYTPDALEIASFGNQISTATSSSPDFYIGGGFSAIKNNAGSLNIQKISITENGTIDEENNLSNVRLYYDLDTSAPYDCSGESFDGSEAQFGTNQNFSNLSGTSTFSDAGLEVNNTQSACFYVVLDIAADAPKDATINLGIADPATDIEIDSTGDISPLTGVFISGSTAITKEAELDQIYYRWQQDDENEELGTWLASQNTPIQSKKSEQVRLRFEIANNGSVSSGNINYQLEFGVKTSSCDAIVTWNTVPTSNTSDWQIIDSPHLTNGNPSQNIPNGLIDEMLTFVPGEILDTSNISSGISLTEEEFTEILYSIKPTASVSDEVYCFRLTNNGSDADFKYSDYPELGVVGDFNIYIKKISSAGLSVWGATKRVNVSTNAVDQEYPKIAYTDNSGTAATTSIAWQDKRNGNKDIFMQNFQEDGTRVFANDIQISASTSDEYSPALAIESNDDTIVAWVENSDAREKIYAQKISQAGIPVWTNPILLASSSINNHAPSIATEGDNIYLTYSEYDAALKTVKIAKFNASGTMIWNKDAYLEAPTSNKFNPDIKIKNSIIIVSWTDERYGNKDVFSQRFDLDGNIQWTKDLKLNLIMTATDQENSKIIINSANDFYALWQSDENSFADLYAGEFIDPSLSSPIPGVPIVVSGTKQIGDSPVILEYSTEHTSDASGEINIALEWDSPGYSFQVGASSPLNIISTSVPAPLEILPDENKSIILYVD